MQCRCLAYALQELLKNEVVRLKEHQILTPLGVDKRAKWCNNFLTVPKLNGTVCMCLCPMILNQALIRPLCRGQKINYILPKLTNAHYMTLIHATSGYHNLKFDLKIIILNHICMSIWQEQIYHTTVRSGTSR